MFSGLPVRSPGTARGFASRRLKSRAGVTGEPARGSRETRSWPRSSPQTEPPLPRTPGRLRPAPQPPRPGRRAESSPSF